LTVSCCVKISKNMLSCNIWTELISELQLSDRLQGLLHGHLHFCLNHSSVKTYWTVTADTRRTILMKGMLSDIRS